MINVLFYVSTSEQVNCRQGTCYCHVRTSLYLKRRGRESLLVVAALPVPAFSVWGLLLLSFLNLHSGQGWTTMLLVQAWIWLSQNQQLNMEFKWVNHEGKKSTCERSQLRGSNEMTFAEQVSGHQSYLELLWASTHQIQIQLFSFLHSSQHLHLDLHLWGAEEPPVEDYLPCGLYVSACFLAGFAAALPTNPIAWFF